MLSHNETVQEKLSQYGVLNQLGFKRSQPNVTTTIDDTLFYFDGDDTEDAEDDLMADDELFEDKHAAKKRAETSLLTNL